MYIYENQTHESTMNPAWENWNEPNDRSASISKFIIGHREHYGTRYSTMADLLGLFLSLIGPAPIRATKRNCYLPLTAIYCRWSKVIFR